jgi:hypothetical protein
MELPTYTNIWKIEKRLYKLYDFRLPMPLPVGQVAAFLAIAVPYALILSMAGMPFSHTWIWLYVLPPGVLAWLVTRPVLEGKRLPELVLSQLRYAGEPRTWCRLTPLTEKDEIVVFARVWRSAGYARPAVVLAAQPAGPAAEAVAADDAVVITAPGPTSAQPRRPDPVRQAGGAAPVRARGAALPSPAATGSPLGDLAPAARAAPPAAAPAPRAPRSEHGKPVWPVTSPGWPAAGPKPAAAGSGVAEAAPPEVATAVPATPAATAPTGPKAALAEPEAAVAEPRAAVTEPKAAVAEPAPVVRVSGDVGPARLNVVERALRSSPANRAGGWRDPVVVVPGGHRPGKPDPVQRDQARVRLPLPAAARIVVLGCTAGAGQTITTLVTGQLLASLRGEPVAVLDLSDGSGSLTEQARLIPALLPSSLVGADPAARPRPAGGPGERGLQVVTASGSADDPGGIVNAVVARYRLTLADPAAAAVPRTVSVADQLVLVAPASAEAAGALAMTLEWLEAHDHGRLAAGAVTVLNGVSGPSAQHVDKAAAVASGRCRAIVRVPWDERLRARPAAALGGATVHAYTALAGVIVAGLADSAARSAAR